MLKSHTTYTYNHNDNIFNLPFNTENDPEYLNIAENGLKAVLSFLVPDSDCESPFDTDCEGEFIHFERGYHNSVKRPDIEDFKRIIRANPERVITHSGISDCHGPGTSNCYSLSNPLTASDCRGDKQTGENSIAENELDKCQGYYICPEDATDPAKYAAAVFKEYNSYANGECYGCITWEYTRESIADQWELLNRDCEVWGFIGYDYAKDALYDDFNFACIGNDPAQLPVSEV